MIIGLAAIVRIENIELGSGLGLRGSSIASFLGESGSLVEGGSLLFVKDAEEAVSLVQLSNLVVREFVEAISDGNRSEEVEALSIGPNKGASTEREEMESVGARGEEGAKDSAVGVRQLGCSKGNVDLGVAKVVARTVDAFPQARVFVKVCHSNLGDGLLNVCREGKERDPLVNGPAGGPGPTGTVLDEVKPGGINNSGSGRGGDC